MGADRGVGSRIFTGSSNNNDFWRQPVRVRDSVSAAKPTGAVNIDGITPIVNGDRVLFTNLSGGELADNNKVFRAVESGGLVTSWNLDTDGQPSGSPQDGNIIYVKEGTTHADKIYKWTGSGWSEVGSGGGATSVGGSGTVQFSNGAGAFAGDSTNFFWDNTNKRLGIGTNAPSVAIEVIRPSAQFFIRSTSTANATYVGFVNTPGSATAFFGIENSSGINLFGSGIPYSLAIGTVHAAAVTFHTSNVTTPRMLIAAGGNIALGHNNPLYPLHQITSAAGYSAYFKNTSGGMIIGLEDSTGINVTIASQSGVSKIGTNTNHPFHFSTNNINRWQIDTSGHFLPVTTGSLDIGGSSNRVRDLYLSSSFIYGSNANQYIQFYPGGELVISGSSFTQMVARTNSFLMATVNLAAAGDFDMGSNLSGVGYGTLNANVNSGLVTIRSGDTSGSGTSGNFVLRSGNAAGTGNSGNVTIQTGTVVSGTRGTIRLVDASLAGSSVGWVWTLQDTATGRGAWQAASAGGTPGGASGSVQFNNAGVFAGDSAFSWDNVPKVLTVGSTGASSGIAILRSSGAALTLTGPANSSIMMTISTPSYATRIGVEDSSGTGVFGSGTGFAMALGTTTNTPIHFHTNSVTTPRLQIGSTALVHSVDILPNVSSTINIGSTSLRYNDMWARRTLLTNPNPGGVSNVFIIADSDTSEAFLIQMNPAGGLPTGATNVGVLVKSGLRTTLRNFVVTTDVDGVANASATGAIWISTGNKTAGTGNSGSINIITGTSAGGTRGDVIFTARQIAFTSQTITHSGANYGVDQNDMATVMRSAIFRSHAGFANVYMSVSPQGTQPTAPGFTGSSAIYYIGTDRGSAAASQALIISTQNSPQTLHGTGGIALLTGDQTNNTNPQETGRLYFKTGNITNLINSASTGAFDFITGNSAGQGTTGNVNIVTGNNTNATAGNSGSITLQTGTSTAGIRGNIILNTRLFDVSNVSEGKSLPIWKKYTVNHAALQAAALTNDIPLFSLPAYGVIHNVVISHLNAFTGTGFTGYTISVGIAGDLTKYASAFDVFQATGAGVGQTSSVADFESKGGATSIRVAATSVGANLNQSSGGDVEIWVLWGTMQ